MVCLFVYVVGFVLFVFCLFCFVVVVVVVFCFCVFCGFFVGFFVCVLLLFSGGGGGGYFRICPEFGLRVCYARQAGVVDLIKTRSTCSPCISGARCSSVLRAFAHCAMGRRIDPSWRTHWAISRSIQCPTTGVTKAVVWDDTYIRILAANRKCVECVVK